MAIARLPESSLRCERAESSRLAWALIISLAIHLLAYGTYATGKKYHWWQRWSLPTWMQTPRMLTELLQKKPTPQELEQQRQRQQEEPPLLFIDVSPAQAAVEPPKRADYYSDKNAKAANRDATTINSTVPKINGNQTHVAKTEDVPRTKAFPLQPAPAPKPAAPVTPQEPAEEAKPKPTFTAGGLTLAPPSQVERKGEGQADQPKPQSKPRTLQEARARLQPQQQQHIEGLAGQKMKQDGGVANRSLQAAFDTVATPFGAYDAALVAAVQRRWDDLLDQQGFAWDRSGKVTLRFHLNADGSITQMNLVEASVDLKLALLCESAIRDPAPYAPWPADMRRLIGIDYRDITFSFFYN